MLGPLRRSALGRKQRFNLKHYHPAGWELAPVLRGVTKLSLSIVADRVLPLRQPKKQRTLRQD
jgi:hypothetical protein